MTLVIDAGHGGSDAGCAANGLVEKDLTLATALSLHARMAACGLPAYLLRSSDHRLSLSQRGEMARAQGAQQVLSLHFDANPNSDVGRLTCYCNAQDSQSMQLARFVTQTAPAALNARPAPILTDAANWTRRAHNVVHAYGGISTLLVECGFLTNSRHALYLQGGGGMALAAGLFAALAAFHASRNI